MKKLSVKQLIRLFTKLVGISSPSGHEADMALFVERYFNNLGWKTWMDDSGKKNKSNCGNLYAYLEINPKFPISVFCAHMDTVQDKGEKIKALFGGGTFKSDGKTILGADNKAGIVSMIFAANSIDKKRLKTNILFFFTTHEEAGLMGSSLFKFNKRIKFVFNLDNSDKPGVFVYKSLGYLNFKIIVHGLGVHAAKSYEKGKDAILITSRLVNQLPLGKNLKEGWTLNIGTIAGGVRTNVVCDLVELKGELRGFDDRQIRKLISLIKFLCRKVGKIHQTKIEPIFDKESYIPPFNGSKSGKIAKVCALACKNIGLEPIFEESYSTSDANSFSGKGFEVISVSRGGENVHSKKEEIKASDIKKTIRLISEIIYMS